MSSLEELRAERVKKLNILKEKGVNAYPVSSGRNTTCAQARDDFDALSDERVVTLAGRVMALRGQGKLLFLDIFDGTANFQIVCKSDTLEDFDTLAETLDRGDICAFSGTLFETQRGEKSVEAKSWRMLAKALLPLPDKWHGLKDTEERFRKRYLDTLSSEEVRERFFVRAKIITALRNILNKAEYMEVETPVLQAVAGGALAEPFVTHHNALDIDMYLRIAPELYLKQLLVGGFPKVYELGRIFRNEGIDVTHNPEFTMLEYYEAFADATSQRAFTELLVREVFTAALGEPKIMVDEQEVSLAESFAVMTFEEVFEKYVGIEKPFDMDRDALVEEAKKHGVEVKASDAPDKILDTVYKKYRSNIVVPTFIIDYPKAFSPFAKEKEGSDTLIDRFQLVIGGFEVANAFSELNDPEEQHTRFAEQEKKREGGEREISPNDEAYIEAMEYGMPPAGGVGIGVDRLVMLANDTRNIREAILFPTLRPRE
ncbi:MAG: lysine--tRNA ligase [Parcubacteria group bacterium]|nr:lysine--tRNA ligase [Parcubacteria group bacterium]